MSKHTPGPWGAWSVETRQYPEDPTHQAWTVSSRPDASPAHWGRGRDIAHIDAGGTIAPEEVAANARLCAAAPDLKAVVARFVAIWNKRQLASPHEPMLVEEHYDLLAQAVAALARVEGRDR